MTEGLSKMKTQSFEIAQSTLRLAVQELADIPSSDAVRRYSMARAAEFLLEAAASDLHPSYVEEKVGKALLSCAYASGYKLPVEVIVEVEGGCVQETRVTVRNAVLDVEVDVIDHDVLEESDEIEE